MAFGTFKIQAGNFNKGQGQWLRNCLRMPSGNPFRPLVIPVDQLLSINVIDPASKGAQIVEGEFKDGKKFLAIMDHDIVAAIRAAMFDVSIGKKYEAKFPHRKWKKWEKIAVNICLSPLYLLIIMFVAALLMSPSDEAGSNQVASGIEKESVEAYAQSYPTQIELSPDWEKIEVTDAKDDRIGYMIYYKKPPTIAVARSDTSRITHAVLFGLMARGYSPAADRISISVMAVASGQGATGAGFRVYGRSRYRPHKDEVEFLRDVGQ